MFCALHWTFMDYSSIINFILRWSDKSWLFQTLIFFRNLSYWGTEQCNMINGTGRDTLNIPSHPTILFEKKLATFNTVFYVESLTIGKNSTLLRVAMIMEKKIWKCSWISGKVMGFWPKLWRVMERSWNFRNKFLHFYQSKSKWRDCQ